MIGTGAEHESGRRDSKILDFSADSHLGISVKVRSFLGCLNFLYHVHVYMIIYIYMIYLINMIYVINMITPYIYVINDKWIELKY